jgi:hypothetical protein
MFQLAPDGQPGIPLAKLASTTDEILFYDDVPLFEDELHDNGMASLSVRIVNNFRYAKRMIYTEHVDLDSSASCLTRYSFCYGTSYESIVFFSASTMSVYSTRSGPDKYCARSKAVRCLTTKSEWSGSIHFHPIGGAS